MHTKIIGITGGIGSGKSTVLDLLKNENDAYIIKADDVGHDIMKKKGLAFSPIIKEFGEKLIGSDGEIDKEKLSKIVYADKNKLEKLNEIVHPLVIDEIKKLINFNKSSYKIICVESAILFESGCDSLCDETWFVDASEETRIHRLIINRGYSKEKCISIIKNQDRIHNDKEKSDIIIDNNDKLCDLSKKIAKYTRY